MFRSVPRFAVVLFIGFGAPNAAQAQMILEGCTGFFPNNPHTSRLVDIDTLTGQATNLRDIGISVFAGIAAQPSSDALYGLTSFASNPANTLVGINVLTGGATPVGPTGLATIVEGDLAFSPVTGLLYGLQALGPSNQRSLFTINPLNGAASVVGSLGTQGDYSAMAISANGTMYVIDCGPSGNALFETVDPNTGSILTTLTMNSHLGSAVGMAIDPQSGTIYVSDGGVGATGLLFSVNANTGALSPIGPTGALGGIAGLTFVSVPEPSSMTLVVLGAVFLRFGIRRRNPRHSNRYRLPCTSSCRISSTGSFLPGPL
jgi:hypothetical protein